MHSKLVGDTPPWGSFSPCVGLFVQIWGSFFLWGGDGVVVKGGRGCGRVIGEGGGWRVVHQQGGFPPF